MDETVKVPEYVKVPVYMLSYLRSYVQDLVRCARFLDTDSDLFRQVIASIEQVRSDLSGILRHARIKDDKGRQLTTMGIIEDE
jgi:hypothetical protein